MAMTASPRRRGIALIMALLVLTLLVVVVGQLAYTTRIDLQVASNATDGQQALYAAWGGVEFAKGLLRDDVQRNEHDGLADRWARLSKPVKVGDVEVTLTIEDEERKLNLLLLASKHEPYRKWATATLERLITAVREASEDQHEMPPEQLAENIATWIREGKVPGVASDDQAFGEAGQDDQIPMLSLAELLAVEGMTPAILYGPPEPIRDPMAEEEGFEDLGAKTGQTSTLDEILGQAPKQARGLAPFLTVFTTGHINANTVDPLLLKSMSQFITDDVVQAIVTARESGGTGATDEDAPDPNPQAGGEMTDNAFKTVAEVSRIEGLDTPGDESAWKEMQPFITVGSQVFTIRAEALVNRVRKRVEVVVKREAEGFQVLWYKER